MLWILFLDVMRAKPDAHYSAISHQAQMAVIQWSCERNQQPLVCELPGFFTLLSILSLRLHRG
jgi:hypothetical protein